MNLAYKLFCLSTVLSLSILGVYVLSSKRLDPFFEGSRFARVFLEMVLIVSGVMTFLSLV